MSFFDNNYVAALAVGAVVVGIYYLFSSGGQRTPIGTRGANPLPQQQQGVGGMNQQQQQQQMNRQQQQQASSSSPLVKSPMPNKTDDLAMQIATGKSKNWSIILHTKTEQLQEYEKLISSITCGNYKNLLICHQLRSEETDLEKDLQFFKQNCISNPEKFQRHRLVFCSTDKGPEAIARQHEPAMLITTNRQLCAFMSSFLPFCVLLDSASSTEQNSNNSNGIKVEVVASSSGGSRSSSALNKIYIVNSASVVLPS